MAELLVDDGGEGSAHAQDEGDREACREAVHHVEGARVAVAVSRRVDWSVEVLVVRRVAEMLCTGWRHCSSSW